MSTCQANFTCARPIVSERVVRTGSTLLVRVGLLREPEPWPGHACDWGVPGHHVDGLVGFSPRFVAVVVASLTKLGTKFPEFSPRVRNAKQFATYLSIAKASITIS